MKYQRQNKKNNEDKTKVVLSIISKKRKMPRQIVQSDGIFSAKNVKRFLKKSKKGSKMTKRHPSGWNTF